MELSSMKLTPSKKCQAETLNCRKIKAAYISKKKV